MIVNNAIMNIGLVISLQDSFFWINTQNWIIESYGSSIFNFLRNFHTVLHNTEKVFDKIQHTFMIKILNKLGIEGNYLA